MRPLFLFKSEKKTDEEHLKQMRKGLRNIFFYLVLDVRIRFRGYSDKMSGVHLSPADLCILRDIKYTQDFS